MTITMDRARYCSRRIAGLLISNIVLNLFTLVLTMLIGYYSYQLLVALFLKIGRKKVERKLTEETETAFFPTGTPSSSLHGQEHIRNFASRRANNIFI